MPTIAAAGSTATSTGAILRIAVPGFDAVEVKLARFQQYLHDLRDFWRYYFAPAFYRQLERNYETEGSMVGGWAPLSPRYLAWKSRVAPGRGILQFTGRLQQSLTWNATEPGAGGIFIAERAYVVLGTSVPYAQYHQLGGARLPRRSVLFPGQNAASTFGRLLHRYAVDMAGEAGLRAAQARASSTFGGQFL